MINREREIKVEDWEKKNIEVMISKIVRIRKEKWSKSLRKQRYEEEIRGNERLDGEGRKRYKNINLKRF